MTNANLNARIELIKVSLMAYNKSQEAAKLKDESSPPAVDMSLFEVSAVEAYDIKMMLLEKWGVPILHSAPPVGASKTKDNAHSYK